MKYDENDIVTVRGGGGYILYGKRVKFNDAYLRVTAFKFGGLDARKISGQSNKLH